jgi:hypothetical protein
MSDSTQLHRGASDHHARSRPRLDDDETLGERAYPDALAEISYQRAKKRVAQATPVSTTRKDGAARDSNRETREAAAATLRTFAAEIDYASEILEHVLTDPNPRDEIRRVAVMNAFQSARDTAKQMVSFCDGLGFDRARWSKLPELEIVEAALQRFSHNFSRALGTYSYKGELEPAHLTNRIQAFRDMTGSRPGPAALAHEPTSFRGTNALRRTSVPELSDAIDRTAASILAGNTDHLPRLVQLVTELEREYPYVYFNDRGTFPTIKHYFTSAAASLSRLDTVPLVQADTQFRMAKRALENQLAKHP